MSDNNEQIIDTIRRCMPTYTEKSDIMTLITQRLEFGRKKYGHGVRVHATNLNDYNNKWTDSIQDMNWASMMLEEAVDGMVYSAAEIFRIGEDHPNAAYLKDALEHMTNGARAMLRYKSLHT